MRWKRWHEARPVARHVFRGGQTTSALPFPVTAGVRNSSFLLFVLVGGFAAAINFGSRILLSLAMPYIAAITIAYLLGMLTAFVLNRRFVFTNASRPVAHQAALFTAVNAFALAQTIAISLIFSRFVFPWMGMAFHPETVAHALGVAAPVVTSYFAHKNLTFSKSRDSQA